MDGIHRIEVVALGTAVLLTAAGAQAQSRDTVVHGAAHGADAFYGRAQVHREMAVLRRTIAH